MNVCEVEKFVLVELIRAQACQSSPTITKFPKILQGLSIHYDAQLFSSTYFTIKTGNIKIVS